MAYQAEFRRPLSSHGPAPLSFSKQHWLIVSTLVAISEGVLYSTRVKELHNFKEEWYLQPSLKDACSVSCMALPLCNDGARHLYARLKNIWQS